MMILILTLTIAKYKANGKLLWKKKYEDARQIRRAKVKSIKKYTKHSGLTERTDKEHFTLCVYTLLNP